MRAFFCFQPPSPTRGAPKKAPRSKTPCYPPPYRKAKSPVSALLSIPAPLPARYPLTCAAPPHNSHRRGGLPTTRQNPRTQPSPQLRATLPVAKPPPQLVQTPRKIYPLDNHLPMRLSTRLYPTRLTAPISRRNTTLPACHSGFFPTSQKPPDWLFLTHPVACRATRRLISIGKRRARRTWPLRA